MIDNNYKRVGNWTMNFGKHKGTKFDDLEDEYVMWLWESRIFKNPSKHTDPEKAERFNKTNALIHEYLGERYEDHEFN